MILPAISLGVLLPCVLDTGVLVAALRSSAGASRRILLAALNGKFELLLSVPLVLEYESVLKRPEQLAIFKIHGSDVDMLMNDLISIAKPVRLAFRWRPRLPDPGDDMVLETAANGGAAAIITFNLRHFGGVPDDFGIEVLTPGEALEKLGGAWS
jgi:predicted nucleic acid-binding protein